LRTYRIHVNQDPEKLDDQDPIVKDIQAYLLEKDKQRKIVLELYQDRLNKRNPTSSSTNEKENTPSTFHKPSASINKKEDVLSTSHKPSTSKEEKDSPFSNFLKWNGEKTTTTGKKQGQTVMVCFLKKKKKKKKFHFALITEIIFSFLLPLQSGLGCQ